MEGPRSVEVYSDPGSPLKDAKGAVASTVGGGEPITLEASSTDPLGILGAFFKRTAISGTQYVGFAFPPNTFSNVIPLPLRGQVSTTWTPTVAQNGTNTLVAEVLGAAGNRLESPPMKVRVDFPPAEVEAAFLAMINEARAAVGVGPVVYDEALQAIARDHSFDMAHSGVLGIWGFQDFSDGSTVSSRAAAAGVTGTLAVDSFTGEIYGGPGELRAQLDCQLTGWADPTITRIAAGYAFVPGSVHLDHWTLVRVK